VLPSCNPLFGCSHRGPPSCWNFCGPLRVCHAVLVFLSAHSLPVEYLTAVPGQTSVHCGGEDLLSSSMMHMALALSAPSSVWGDAPPRHFCFCSPEKHSEKWTLQPSVNTAGCPNQNKFSPELVHTKSWTSCLPQQILLCKTYSTRSFHDVDALPRESLCGTTGRGKWAFFPA
jgi:hypothetical protein